MGYRPSVNTSSIIYTYKYIQNMYPKVGQVEETKEEKKERKITNNNEIYVSNQCMNKTQGNILKVVNTG
jgi:hypothetical protein